MRWYFLGLLIVGSAAAVAFDVSYYRATVASLWWGYDPQEMRYTIGVHALSLGLVPALGGLIGAWLLHAARPMRLFSFRGKRRVAKTMFGMVGAALSVGLILLALPLAEGRVPDAAVTAACGVASSVVILLAACARDRVGHCVRCGYDLRGSRRSGKCPECGMPCGPALAPTAA